MKILALSLLALLAACGGSGGPGSLDLEAVMPPIGDPTTRDDPSFTIETPEGRFGFLNAQLPVVMEVEVFDRYGGFVDAWDGIVVPTGDLYEVPMGDDLPAGSYIVRVYFGGGSAAKFFARAPGHDGPIFTWGDREVGF